MKLTKKQQRVVDLMQQGYELGYRSGFRSSAWLQFGGIGNGGKSEDVHLSTFLSLRDKAVIEIAKEQYPSTSYKLREALRRVEEAS